jgi:hypothetical protein
MRQAADGEVTVRDRALATEPPAGHPRAGIEHGVPWPGQRQQRRRHGRNVVAGRAPQQVARPPGASPSARALRAAVAAGWGRGPLPGPAGGGPLPLEPEGHETEGPDGDERHAVPFCPPDTRTPGDARDHRTAARAGAGTYGVSPPGSTPQSALQDVPHQHSSGVGGRGRATPAIAQAPRDQANPRARSPKDTAAVTTCGRAAATRPRCEQTTTRDSTPVPPRHRPAKRAGMLTCS